MLIFAIIAGNSGGGDDWIQTRGLRFNVEFLFQYARRFGEGMHTNESVEAAREDFIGNFTVTNVFDVSN